MVNLKLDLENTQKKIDKTIKSLLPRGRGIENKLFKAIEYSILSTCARGDQTALPLDLFKTLCCNVDKSAA